MQEIPPDLRTPKELARLLGVHAATVRRWIREGVLTRWRVGGRVRARESEALALVRRDDQRAG
jgi:excisionase family DNA binding protein